jgi:hypothetical protein
VPTDIREQLATVATQVHAVISDLDAFIPTSDARLGQGYGASVDNARRGLSELRIIHESMKTILTSVEALRAPGALTDLVVANNHFLTMITEADEVLTHAATIFREEGLKSCAQLPSVGMLFYQGILSKKGPPLVTEEDLQPDHSKRVDISDFTDNKTPYLDWQGSDGTVKALLGEGWFDPTKGGVTEVPSMVPVPEDQQPQ